MWVGEGRGWMRGKGRLTIVYPNLFRFAIHDQEAQTRNHQHSNYSIYLNEVYNAMKDHSLC
jgi:hypothetical protein